MICTCWKNGSSYPKLPTFPKAVLQSIPISVLVEYVLLSLVHSTLLEEGKEAVLPLFTAAKSITCKPQLLAILEEKYKLLPSPHS